VVIACVACAGSFGQAHGRVALRAEPAAVPRSGAKPPLQVPDAQLEPLDWAALDGWAADDHAAAFAAFLTSCRPIARSSEAERRQARPILRALYDVCRLALRSGPLDGEAARAFFEHNFRPMRIARLGDAQGFLTGYYEPILDGSLVPTAEFTAPIYGRPANLTYSGRHLRPADEPFPNKGINVGRLAGRRKVVPYYDRLAIENGALAGRKLELCWVRDQTDVLFAQIQGSAQVRLEDGSVLRLNYDSHNGYPYTPIGRVLIERGIIPREQMSLQRLRDWLAANPDLAKEVRGKNQAYTFFRVAKLAAGEQPVGGQGVSLTPGRSIAVDKALHAYGTLFFIEADLPTAGLAVAPKFRRLMVAQDTGSAIVGPARADIYFGPGDEAGRVAGRIRTPGTFVMLIPREMDPVAVAARVPMPPPRPVMKVAGADHKHGGNVGEETRRPRTAHHSRRHRW
jgi:membrane-bound lytic murein transglycosylase A